MVKQRFTALQRAAVATLPVVISGCADVMDVPGPGGSNPAIIEWDLPRTQIKVDATFQLLSCIENAKDKTVQLNVKTKATVAELPVVDLAAHRSLVMENLQDWRTANTVHTTSWVDDGGLIKSFGNKSEDKTADIAGNLLTAATKIAGAALAGPPPFLDKPAADQLRAKQTHSIRQKDRCKPRLGIRRQRRLLPWMRIRLRLVLRKYSIRPARSGSLARPL